MRAQEVCDAYVDFFRGLNKHNPAFDNLAYTTPPIRVDMTSKPNLVTFTITDRDNFPNTKFEFSSNDTNFNVEAVIDPNSPSANQFSFNFKGTLNYNINNAHRYIVEVTVSDKGFPTRTGKALFIVPLINYNVNAPQYTPPVVIAAAITLEPGTVLSILNAWDIDGDKVEFTLEPSKNSLEVINTLKLTKDGVLKLDKSLLAFSSSMVNFVVTLTDDGSSCGPNGKLFEQYNFELQALFSFISTNN